MTATESKSGTEASVQAPTGRAELSAALVATFIRLPLFALLFVGVVAVTAILGIGDALAIYNGYLNLLIVIVDVVSLVLVAWFLSRENRNLTGLFDFNSSRILRDVALGLGLFVVLTIVFQIATVVSTIGVISVFGESTPPSSVQPPLWIFALIAVISPVTIAVAEESVYRGYALPRIERATDSTALAVLVTSLGFGLQHAMLPLNTVEWSLVRVLSTFVIGLVFGVIYIRWRRLLPLIIAHWALDFIFLGLLPLAGAAGVF